ncbi:MAG: hypothetical protein EXR86_00710 [Gammaproteobacteria bacterium]|nr:hypothetical protein [Gammaproteobacteria bacterium]
MKSFYSSSLTFVKLQRHFRLHSFLFALTIAACASQPALRPVPAVATPEQQAKDAIARGDFLRAAGQYAELSTTVDAQASTTYRLKAGLVYWDLGDQQRAQLLLTDNPGSSTQDLPLQNLASAVTSARDSASDSFLLALLNSLPIEGFDLYEKGLYLRTLGKTQLNTRDTAAATNLLNSELFPLPSNRRTELTHLIWAALRAAPPTAELPQYQQRNPNLPGWLALLDETRRSELEPAALAAALTAWQLQFPTHPANEILIEEIIENAEELSAPVRQVALLLPLEGDLATYAEAIRDGFLALRYAENNSGLTINVYSASGDGVRKAYDQAVAEGAQLIVGPLDKPGLETLIAYDKRSVPILALNSVPPTAGAVVADNPAVRITQFGLSPEDEATDLAKRAWSDGHCRMAIIIPANVLGTRISSAFKTEWGQLGGVVVDETRYTNEVSAYKSAVRSTFSLAQSEARAAELRRILHRPLTFVARARADLDAIMLIAMPMDARQIIPQFRYFGVDHLPIYSTSHVFAEAGGIRNDDDLDGIMFGTMPWLLDITDRSVHDTIRRRWPRRGVEYDRFYAFGVDAYRLISLIPEMIRQPSMLAMGSTGRLSLDRSGRIRRTLSWAKYQNGVVVNLAD